MKKEVQKVHYFLYSQAFADGFRITFAILLPSLILSYFNHFDIGVTISLGAMCVSLTDSPGPILHKRNGMLFSCFFVFIISFITVFARLNLYTMGVEILFVCFFFSMFNVYGNRATSVANGVMLIMILTMDKPIEPSNAFINATLITSGGIFYMLISLMLYKLRPYRIAQRALGESIREVAKYLSIKADFYDISTDLEMNYKNLLNQQVIVNEKQDFVRELLFKTRQIVSESTVEGKKLVLAFIETVDLFEAITASYYHYELIRTEFAESGILEKISKLIRNLSEELIKISLAIQSNSVYKKSHDYDNELIILKNEIDHLPHSPGKHVVLIKILINIRRLLQGLNDINQYFFGQKINASNTGTDHSRFVSHQSLDPAILWNNLSIHSSVFKHSIRVSCACILGYIISKFISNGHHSYWILMTIAFMLKPAFSLTKQRNIQRIKGTIAGAAIGFFVLFFIHNKDFLFAIMVVFMLGTYSFIRINYLTAVICTTPFVLILFAFLGVEFRSLAEERMIDTAIGCALAFASGYLLFPQWEASQLKMYMLQTLKGNIMYMSEILNALYGKEVNLIDYKLARKEVYVSSANLSSAFQRMLSEPKSKQSNHKDIHQFVVLNMILLSNIATVGTTLLSGKVSNYPATLQKVTIKALQYLKDGCEKLEYNQHETKSNKSEPHIEKTNMNINANNELLEEQLKFICKICNEINRTITTLMVHKPFNS